MAKKLSGKLVEWDDARGFGFLRCGSARVLVHRREFSERRKAIEKGDRLRFLMGEDDKGRACARDIEHLGNGGALSLVAFLLCVLSLVLPVQALDRYTPNWLWVGGYFLVINVLTAVVYSWDKWKARNGGWRISEMQLHLCELLGGWPAAFLMQRLLRHKTSKLSFQVIFWLIVIGYQVAAFEVISGCALTRGAWDIIAGKLG